MPPKTSEKKELPEPTIEQISNLHIKVDVNQEWYYNENGKYGPGYYLINK
jgi:hypothetical protein